jgi:hypothetical protein
MKKSRKKVRIFFFANIMVLSPVEIVITLIFINLMQIIKNN